MHLGWRWSFAAIAPLTYLAAIVAFLIGRGLRGAEVPAPHTGISAGA